MNGDTREEVLAHTSWLQNRNNNKPMRAPSPVRCSKWKYLLILRTHTHTHEARSCQPWLALPTLGLLALVTLCAITTHPLLVRQLFRVTHF